MSNKPPKDWSQETDFKPFTPEEMRVFEECRFESFWYRCVPIGATLVAATHYLVSRGYLKANPRRGSLYKCLAAWVVGHSIGKVSYHGACTRKMMALENSDVAEELRQGRGWVGVIKNRFKEQVHDFGDTRDDGDLWQYQPSDEEQRVLERCQSESFWWRCVPLMVVFVALVEVQVRRGAWWPHPRRGTLYKNLLALAAGYIIGKMSYSRQCNRYICRLKDSQLAEIVREGGGCKGVEGRVGDRYRRDTDIDGHNNKPYTGVDKWSKDD